MLNEERIKLMTKMATYEAKEGKMTFRVGKYFKSDYISYQLLKSAISITVAYLLMISLWVLAKMEYIMENIHKIDLVNLGRNLVILYILLLIAYLVIAFDVYYLKYDKAIRSLGKYRKQLKQLGVLYENEKNIAVSQESLRGEPHDDNFIRN